MTLFRTEIQLQKVQDKIDYKSNLFLIGSCFTQNIGAKLAYFKFKHIINPFGILFQPKAIENLIVKSLNDKKYTENDLIFYNNHWHCFEAHSDFSTNSKETILHSLNDAVQQTKKQLKKASHIIITLGTSWVYQFTETNNFVANCHKIPQKKFNKKILSVTEISNSLKNIISTIAKANPLVKVIFTVSPVRHLKDGFVENKQSKAHLITAIHHAKATYFPAYEIMMDDLRDYRFYKKDMLHPNEVAIDYIWQKFVTIWINSSAKEVMEQVNQIQKGLAHKPFDKNTSNHLQFTKNLQSKIKSLEKETGIRF